jgi:alpha-1,6-mannosyltransferase
MLAVALVSATPNSPFSPVLPAGYEPSGPLRWVSDLIGLGHLNTTGLIAAGLFATAAAAAAFLFIVREAWNNRISMRTVAILTLSFHAAVLTLPLLFSRDVYSYGYYGRIVSTYGANPYVFTPKDFPLNSLWHLTWPGWRGTPSVYGPLFTWVSAFLTGTAKRLPDLITGFQLLAAMASLGTIAIVAGLARRIRPERAVFAVAAIGLNPIVIFHVIGGGHNDMLVAFFIAAAAALLFARRELLSAVALGLGMSVKATAVVPLILLVVAVAANTPPERRRRMLLTYAGVVGGVWLLLAIPYLQASNPTLGLIEVAGHDSWMAPGQLLVRLFSGVGGLIGGDPYREPAAMIARVLLFAFSAIGIAFIAREIWRRPAARTPTALVAAWGWALLVLILPSPVLFTWYLVWVLPLAWALPRIARRGVVIMSAFFIITQLVTESSRLPGFLEHVKLPFGHPIAIAVCVWVGLDLIRRLRRGMPFEGESAEPTLGDSFESGPHPRVPVPTRLGAIRPMPATTMRRK